MDELRCAIKIEDRGEGKPTRLFGTLMVYNTEARDLREVFESGSLTWDEGGIVVNRMHQRASPIMRVTPIEVDGRVTIDQELPDTVAGRDCASEVRSGLLTGMSVEFNSIRESFVAGVRRIAQAHLRGAAVCDSPAYAMATVEARAKAVRRASDLHTQEFLL